MYLLVEFTDNSELAVVPDSWLEGSQCAVWPPYKSSSRLIKAVIHKEPPTESWKAHPIRVLYKNELYEKVRSKLKRAEVESDLQTETDDQPNQGRPNRRKRTPPQYSSSSEDEVPVPPPPKKTAKQMPSGLPAPPRYLEIQASAPVSNIASVPRPTVPSQVPSASTNIPDSLPSPRELPFHQGSTSDQGNATQRMPLADRSPSNPQRSTSNHFNATQWVPHTDRSPSNPRSQMAVQKSTVASGLPSPKSPVNSGLARDVRLFTILEKIREEQRHHTALLNTLFTRLGGHNDSSEHEDGIPEGINFPINSKEEMQAFEEKVKDDVSINKLVVNYLASIGGASVENMTYRIFRHTMTNKCCQAYNWTGTRNKAKFASLSLPLIVKRAVKKSFRLVTSSDIERIAKSFLKSAADRDGGRKKRMKEPAGSSSLNNTNDSTDSEGTD